MSDRLQSLLPIRSCNAGLPVAVLLTAVIALGGCFGDAESPGDDSTGMAEQTTIATTATGSEPDSSSTSSSTGDVTPTGTTTGTTESESSDGSTSGATTSKGASGDPTGTESDSGSGPEDCVAGTDNVTAMGSVVASSTFGDNEYPAALGVDGNPGTSWFSAGPGPNAGPSTFTWTAEEPHCLSTLVLTGNGAHTNPDFHEQFGFETVTVRVFLDEKAVFQLEYSLEGTPDPTVTAELGNVLGDQVELELSGHEDPACGGFAEMLVTGS